MQGSTRILIVFAATLIAALALSSVAHAQDEAAPADQPVIEGDEGEDEADPKPANASIKLKLKGLKGKSVRVNKRVAAFATVRPFVPGQKLRIGVYRKGKPVKRANKTITRKKGSNAGTVKMKSPRLIEPAKYSVRASHKATDEQKGASKSSRRFGISYPKIGRRSRGALVQLFHSLLHKQGYRNAPSGKTYSAATSRAVHAFRKVNGMARTWSASPGIFKKLAAGKGAFKLRYPGAGQHVETDISRQVMVLADKGKPQMTYHISSGAPGTPSDRGRYTFYRKDPGYNSIGMYYSVYYNRGEATHGYKSVPDYPASHGCLRNPIPDAKTIYNWINLGDPIWVYN